MEEGRSEYEQARIAVHSCMDRVSGQRFVRLVLPTGELLLPIAEALMLAKLLVTAAGGNTMPSSSLN